VQLQATGKALVATHVQLEKPYLEPCATHTSTNQDAKLTVRLQISITVKNHSIHPLQTLDIFFQSTS
jgi:hypothetical protein